MRKNAKKIMSLILALSMLFSVAPAAVFAEATGGTEDANDGFCDEITGNVDMLNDLIDELQNGEHTAKTVSRVYMLDNMEVPSPYSGIFNPGMLGKECYVSVEGGTFGECLTSDGGEVFGAKADDLTSGDLDALFAAKTDFSDVTYSLPDTYFGNDGTADGVSFTGLKSLDLGKVYKVTADIKDANYSLTKGTGDYASFAKVSETDYLLDYLDGGLNYFSSMGSVLNLEKNLKADCVIDYYFSAQTLEPVAVRSHTEYELTCAVSGIGIPESESFRIYAEQISFIDDSVDFAENIYAYFDENDDGEPEKCAADKDVYILDKTEWDCEEDMPQHEHDYVVTSPAVEPTASCFGLTEEKCCSECCLLYQKQTPVAKLSEEGEETGCEHNYTVNSTTPATCKQAGETVSTCTECGDTKTDPIPALGHDYVNGVCTRCGAKKPAAGINLEYVQKNDLLYADVYFDDLIGMTSFDATIEYDPSALEFVEWKDGADANKWDYYNEFAYAANPIVAGKVLLAGYFYPNLLSSEDYVRYCDADKNINGEHYHAIRFTFNIKGDLTGKSMKLTGSASGCTPDTFDRSFPISVETACAHKYTVTSTTPATCKQAGETVYTCTECGDTKTDPIPALGHDYVNGVCSRCGAKEDAVIIASGFCGAYGDNLTYTLTDDGIFTVSGEGEMKSYQAFPDYIYAPWEDYSDMITKVVIEDGVTSVGGGAFIYCSALKNVELPAGVESIGNSAFYDCSSLEEIRIPDSVRSIGEAAFGSCTALTELEIPEGVVFIGSSAFADCDSIKNMTIPASVSDIRANPFEGCAGLEKITVTPENEKYYVSGNCLIDRDAKSIVSVGKNFTIPADGSVEAIGGRAFCFNESFTSIVIPGSITEIGFSFYGCSNLKDVYYLDSEDKWSDMDVSPEGNEALLNANVYFNYNTSCSHSFKEEKTSATCTTEGRTIRKCSKCGTYTVLEKIDRLGHNYVNGVCSRCGAKKPAAGINLEYVQKNDLLYADVYFDDLIGMISFDATIEYDPSVLEFVEWKDGADTDKYVTHYNSFSHYANPEERVKLYLWGIFMMNCIPQPISRGTAVPIRI